MSTIRENENIAIFMSLEMQTFIEGHKDRSVIKNRGHLVHARCLGNHAGDPQYEMWKANGGVRG